MICRTVCFSRMAGQQPLTRADPDFQPLRHTLTWQSTTFNISLHVACYILKAGRSAVISWRVRRSLELIDRFRLLSYVFVRGTRFKNQGGTICELFWFQKSHYPGSSGSAYRTICETSLRTRPRDHRFLHLPTNQSLVSPAPQFYHSHHCANHPSLDIPRA